MTTDALGTTGGVVSGVDHRLAIGGMIAVQGPTELDVRTGVLIGVGATALLTGTAATGTMTVSVAPFHAVTARNNAGGAYLGPVQEATATVNIAAAPASNSRIDVVYVKESDADASVLTPDASTGAALGVVTGTAAVSPTKPALPVGALELGTVTVAAGATSTNGAGVTVANTARITSARGTRVPVRTQADRDALTQYAGLEVYRLDTGAVELSTGTTWRASSVVSFPVAVLRQATAQSGLPTGFSVITLDTADIDTHSAVTTSSGRFTVPSGQGGTYAIEGSVQFPANGSTVGARLIKNGVTIPASRGGGGTSPSGTDGVVTGRHILVLNAGDYIQLQGSSSASGWLTIVGADQASWMAVERIR